MSTSKAKKRAANARRAAQIAAAQRRARRRAIASRGGAVALGLLLVSLVVLALVSRGDGGGGTGGDAPAAISGSAEFDVPSRNHVTTDVEYPQSPPVGGDHDPAWQTCGSYDEPVREENAVHSMEHGAVWITYEPTLDQAQVDIVRAAAAGQTHVLVSPREGLDAPIMLSAWGRQLGVESADDERIAAFIRDFQEGPDTPELGAPCSGGIGTPA